MQINPRLKEKVFIHTNKTSYFPDDVIWFKAYVGDSINQPSVQTKVLEVKLFDSDGSQLFDRSVAISSGTGNGQIALSDSVAPGTYYLQARTKYMRNFGEDHQYLQKIRVLGQELPNTEKVEDFKYDVQLLPESGNLIEDVENVLGIKAMLNGKSIGFKGSILNKNGDTITTFKSEHEGLSSCSFVYKKGETYRTKIQLQDTLLEQDVPTALAKGVSLHVNNRDEEYLEVSLKTNEATFYNQVYSNYTLLYHQDRQLFGLVSIARLDSITSSLKTKKNVFPDGVHTVTFFADDRPTTQRKFYIETNRRKSIVSLEKSISEKDSITYSLSSKGNKNNLDVAVSISVLQKNSEVADLKNTIRSAFLFTPHIRGFIENPAYYFKPINKKRKEHIDLLLLTQGWTSYTLNELIEEINPSEKYSFETGFELNGSIKEKIKHKNLVLIPNNFSVVDKIPLKGKSKFAFQNLGVFNGDTIRVAYQNWLGKIIKPTKIEYDTTEIKGNNKLRVQEVKNLSAQKDTRNFNTINNYEGSSRDIGNPLRNLEGTIDLDEVTVTEKNGASNI